MSEGEKGLGSKILGLFVETEAEAAPGAKSSSELVAEIAEQAALQRPPAEPPSLRLEPATALQAQSPADFEAIFREAGMDAEELDRVKKAEELLKSLPEATPMPIKRQIVEASLKAFGFQMERILLAAHNQRRALDAYVKVKETATARAITEAEQQIRSLNERIGSLRAEIEKRTSSLAGLSQAAQSRKAQVQKVIDFFQSQPAATQGESSR